MGDAQGKLALRALGLRSHDQPNRHCQGKLREVEKRGSLLGVRLFCFGASEEERT